MREDRRRGDGQLSPAWRRVDLRHAGAAVAGLQHALSAGRRAGQLRLDRRRPARGDAVHRSASEGARRRRDGGSRQGDRRLRPELRRDDGRADGVAGAHSESARQWLIRHRGGHGDQRSTAQPARSHRRRHLGDRDRAGARHEARQEREAARADEFRQGPGLPDGRVHRRPIGDRIGIPHGPRRDSDARQGLDRAGEEGRQAVDHHHRDSVSGEQGAADREDRRARWRKDHRRHFGSARRIRPRRHAHRHRAEARRSAGSDPEQPVQAHAAAAELRRHHARHRRRPAEGAEPRRARRELHRLPPRGRHSPHAVRAAQGRGAVLTSSRGSRSRSTTSMRSSS